MRFGYGNQFLAVFDGERRTRSGSKNVGTVLVSIKREQRVL